MKKWEQQVGRWGEEQAARFLRGRGYTILDRNYHTPAGEIDLIASQFDRGVSYLVFVEVKTRSSLKYGYPEQGVTRRKWDHLLEAVKHYLAANPDLEQDWRVDVIAVQRSAPGAEPEIGHFENVIFDHEQD